MISGVDERCHAVAPGHWVRSTLKITTANAGEQSLAVLPLILCQPEMSLGATVAAP